MLNRRWYIYCDVNSKSLLNSGSFLTYKSPVSHSIFAIKRKWVLSAALSLPVSPPLLATSVSDCISVAWIHTSFEDPSLGPECPLAIASLLPLKSHFHVQFLPRFRFLVCLRHSEFLPLSLIFPKLSHLTQVTHENRVPEDFKAKWTK